MNLEYISGFFDADGSISLVKMQGGNRYRTIKIDFTNVYIEILLEIKDFLLKEYGINGYISTKNPRKINHSTSYALSFTYRNALQLSELLNSRHPKKIHRINTVNKYFKNVTVRNGKYNEKQKSRKLAFERLFFVNH